MEDLAILAIEHARARTFFGREARGLIVIDSLPARDIFLRKRHMVVVVEIVSERRYPRELPSHSLLERFDLRPRGPRYRDESRISLRHVQSNGVKLVRDKRAAGTSF